MLGGTLTVTSLGGEELDVELPAGVQPGEVIIIKRAGLPAKGGGQPGNFHVQVRVVIPRNLNADEVAIVEQLAERRGDDMGGDGRGLFQRLREVFR
jgi:molecular chaperone DnaJ